MTQNPQIEAKACPHCGAELQHIESLAKSFDPPRVYHEWHHPENADCWLRKRLGTIVFTSTDRDATECVEAWNRRASQEAAAPSEAMRDELLAADASDPEATFDNGADMLDWLNAPAAAPSEEPVAWDVCTEDGTVTQNHRNEAHARASADYFNAQGDKRTVKPLYYASPAVAPVAVSVKPYAETAIRKAVYDVLHTNEWPIYQMADDRGLDRSEYADFAIEVLRILSSIIPATKP